MKVAESVATALVFIVLILMMGTCYISDNNSRTAIKLACIEAGKTVTWMGECR